MPTRHEAFSDRCGNAECGVKLLRPPFLQCARCKAETYCSKDCQVRLHSPCARVRPAPIPRKYTILLMTTLAMQKKAWKAGHKRECTPGRAATIAAQCRRAVVQAARQQVESPADQLTRELMELMDKLDKLKSDMNWQGVMAMEEEALAVAREAVDAHPEAAGDILGVIGYS